MNGGGRLVPGHRQPSRWIACDRGAEIAGAGSFANAGVDGFAQRSPDEVNGLADVENHDGDAAVLADRHTLGSRDLVVLDDLRERLTAERRWVPPKALFNASSTSCGMT